MASANDLYFTLLVRKSASDPWRVHFSDHDAQTVIEEQDGVCCGETAPEDTRIIDTDDDPASIAAAVAALNATIDINSRRKG